MPTVTALRDDRRGRVAVELDGAPWRVLPLDVVARAGIAVRVGPIVSSRSEVREMKSPEDHRAERA